MSEMYKTEVDSFDKIFEFLTGDVNWEDYGGKWFRRLSPQRFQVVEILCWEEATGEEHPDGSHWVGLYEVDTSLEDLYKNVLESCGLEIDKSGDIISSHDGEVIVENSEDERWNIVMCEMMVGYGAKAQVAQWCGDDYNELFAKAAEEAKSLEDEEVFEERMNSPANAIGSTMREAMQGDFQSAMIRGLARGDDNARIMTIMHAGRKETEEAEVKLRPQEM